MSQVQNKLQVLKDQFLNNGADSAKSEINSWGRELRKQELITELAETDAIKMLLDSFKGKIITINSILVNQIDLKARERSILLLEKEIRMDFIGVFRDAGLVIKEIEKSIDNELE